MTEAQLQAAGRTLLLQGAFAAPAILARGDNEASLRYLYRLHERVKNDHRGTVVRRIIKRLEAASRNE